MNFNDLIAQIQSQLEELANQEQINQQEQGATNQRIKKLETKIKQEYHRQSELDEEAIQLYRQGEELKAKLEKLNRIAILSQEFRNLYHECQDNQELLQTLYSSISLLAEEESIKIDPQTILNNNQTPLDNNSSKAQQKISDRQKTDSQNKSEGLNTQSSSTSKVDRHQKKEEEKSSKEELVDLTLQNIKTTLPHAELIYKKLIARNLEKYQTYQNLIIDDLDVIWCSLAFIAFGRGAYRQLSFKHHPDLNGSQEAMQLINAAWEISEAYIADTVDSED